MYMYIIDQRYYLLPLNDLEMPRTWNYVGLLHTIVCSGLAQCNKKITVILQDIKMSVLRSFGALFDIITTMIVTNEHIEADSPIHCNGHS